MITLPNRFRGPREEIDFIESDISSRKRDLVNIREAIKRPKIQPFLLKAAVVLSYAHLEGATKTLLGCTLIRIRTIGMTWSALGRNWRSFGIDHYLSQVAKSTPSRPAFCQDSHTEFFLDFPLAKMSIDVEAVLRSLSVVNADSLKKMFVLCNIDSRHYEDLLFYLDDGIIAPRHKIAHGSHFTVEALQAENASTEVLRFLDYALVDFTNILASDTFSET